MGYDVYYDGEFSVNPKMPKSLQNEIIALSQNQTHQMTVFTGLSQELQNELSYLSLKVQDEKNLYWDQSWGVRRWADEMCESLSTFAQLMAKAGFTVTGYLNWTGDENEDMGTLYLLPDQSATYFERTVTEDVHFESRHVITLIEAIQSLPEKVRRQYPEVFTTITETITHMKGPLEERELRNTIEEQLGFR
jgi:hypothetical protein